jgi:hypothetical protein
MQIQLRQTEIVEALKQYIAKQGISLKGKTVEISFTAGRKDAGLSADISIEDSGQQLPDLTGDDDASETTVAMTKPTLAVVTSTLAAPPIANDQIEKAAPKVEAKPAAPRFVPDAKVEAAAAVAAATEAQAVEKVEKKTSSLFG